MWHNPERHNLRRFQACLFATLQSGIQGEKMEQIVLDEPRPDGHQRNTSIEMGVSLSMDSLERILRVNFANYCQELQTVKMELQKEIEAIHENLRKDLAAQKWRIISFLTVVSAALAAAAYFIIIKLPVTV